MPFLSDTADCVTFIVRTICLLILKYCSRSSHALSGSNSMPRVEASIDAARSSAYSPAFSSVCPKAWCSLR